jgi:hypothetical protein
VTAGAIVVLRVARTPCAMLLAWTPAYSKVDTPQPFAWVLPPSAGAVVKIVRARAMTARAGAMRRTGLTSGTVGCDLPTCIGDRALRGHPSN